MQEKKLYVPEEDPYFSRPYIDVEEWREKPVRHYFVHGGFLGTEEGGTQVKFCLYFPEKEKYEGRFFQYVSPAPEDEHMSESLTGEDDKISFALTHGAYYVVTNQGGFTLTGGERLYKSSANGAQFGRKTAQRIYGYEHRPYGYIFGGSGGSFKTMSCMEMTEGVWDGGVPYVLANPMATPNVFCPRVRVMRVLGREGLEKVVDAMEPGGSGDIYESLTPQQQEVLREATRMGFPERGWFSWPFMGDGALMVLAPMIYQIYPQYFTDFWTKPGFAGSDPDSTEAKDRVQFVTVVKELIYKEKKSEDEIYNSVDNSWLNTLIGNNETPVIRLSELPAEDACLYHSRIRVMSGKAKGKECPIDKMEGDLLTVSSAYDGSNGTDSLAGLAEGDQIMIDNSDYLAMQTLQRHQVPDGSYRVYDQYRDADGNPLYPQLPVLIAPLIAQNGGGSVPDGRINGKVITVCSILDESALAWHGDWYRNAVRKAKDGDEENWFRLYYNDHCIHDDRAGYLDDKQHQVDYLGVLHQALLDLADWCEKGIAPLPTTSYRLEDGQIKVPATAGERGGLQPVVDARANGEKSITVKAGESVSFTARIEVPLMAGKVTAASWDYERTDDFSRYEELLKEEDGRTAYVKTTHVFEKPGTYFPVLKAQSSRDGKLDDIFVQCRNLDRVRVVVE